MTDDRFEGLDAPRALPDGLRAGIERALTGGDRDDPGLRGVDAPRPLPRVARVRLEGALAVAAREALSGLDEPRDLPPALRARIEDALVGHPAARAYPAWVVRAIGAAASVVLLAASTLVFVRAGGEGPRDGGLAFDTPVEQGDADVVAPDAAMPGSLDDELGGQGGVPRPPGAGAGLASLADAGDAGPPPPFMFGGDTVTGDAHSAPMTAEPGGAPARAPAQTAAAAPPIRIAAVFGGGAHDEGFLAYLELLNRSGGVRRSEIRVVDADASGARHAIATVNLTAFLIGDEPNAPRPILESAAAPEVVLRGDVFGFASPPERQAHLIADHVFPQPAPGRTAVIYHTREDGFGDRIPAAIERVLRQRNVAALRVTYDPERQPVLVPGEAAFVSMRGEDARTWLAGARAQGYTPPRGIAGIYSLADPDLLSDLPEGARVLSPYRFPIGAERDAIRRETGHPISAELIHGWVTAKAIAAAIWYSDARSGPDLAAAIERTLTGWASGFAPRYEVRPGTRARTPEGLVYRVEGGAFVAETGFLRDPS